MKKTNFITKQAMIAAIYAVVSLALAPISFGTVQARVSEALTMLPVFGTTNIIGISVGCLITNIVGVFSGTNILGWMDVIFGTLATLSAGFLTYTFRNIKFKGLPILSALPPIILNALVVGMELCVMISGGFNLVVFVAQAVSVAIGETISVALGLVLVKVINTNPNLKDIFAK